MNACLTLALLVSLSPSAGSQGLPAVLQPTDYASPSGEFVLFVDPTHRLGSGRAHSTMSRDGALVWATELPFTFWRAVVADNGWVAGYAYTSGGMREGELQVASLSPAGEIVLNEVTPRQQSRVIHGGPDPYVVDLYLGSGSARFVVRVRDSHNPGREESWTYPLSGPERLTDAPRVERIEPPSSRWHTRMDSLPGDLPRLELTPISSTVLGDGASAQPSAGKILQFGLEGGGRMRIVRATQEKNVFTVATTSRQGVVRREVLFGPIGTEDMNLKWWPLAHGRWLVTETRFGAGEASSAWFADEATGDVTPLTTSWPCAFDSVAAVPDGGFVALVTFRRKFTSSNALYRVDDEGLVWWKIGEDNKDEAKLFSPEEVAVTPDGHVAVVDNIRDRIQLFDLAGSYLGKLELAEILPAEPNYPTGLTVDPTGALLLHDFNGEFPLYRIHEDGEVVAALEITPPEGRPLGRMHNRARIAPDGSMWTTDGNALLRVDETGAIDRTVGELPALEALGAMGPARIDRTGRILIQDRETGVLHVFDGAGQRLFFARPAPGDFDSQSSISKIFVDLDGAFFVQSSMGRRGVIEFSADGERIAPVELGSIDLAFSPDGSRWLGVNSFDHVGVRRVTGDETLAFIERAPSGRWFAFSGIADFATDSTGELVVLHTPRSRRSPPNFDSGLSFYGSDGASKGWIPLSGSRLAVSDRWVVVWDFAGTVLLVRRADEVVSRLTPFDRQGNRHWQFGFSADGDELWAIDSDGPTLHKFALP